MHGQNHFKFNTAMFGCTV